MIWSNEIVSYVAFNYLENGEFFDRYSVVYEPEKSENEPWTAYLEDDLLGQFSTIDEAKRFCEEDAKEVRENE